VRVIYSARVEAELEAYLDDGVDKFGARVAEVSLRRIERSLKITLSEQPYLGRLMHERRVYRYVVPRTPFVAYYHVDDIIGQITIVAIFYGAQDRSEFEAE
jgi:plasmid stabilization system protein ParE